MSLQFADQIAMVHPAIPGEIAHAFPEAYEKIWKIKGWEQIDEPTEEEVLAAEAAAKQAEIDAVPVSTEPEVKTVDGSKQGSKIISTSQGEVGNNG